MISVVVVIAYYVRKAMAAADLAYGEQSTHCIAEGSITPPNMEVAATDYKSHRTQMQKL